MATIFIQKLDLSDINELQALRVVPQHFSNSLLSMQHVDDY
jgi:hypothetical protein